MQIHFFEEFPGQKNLMNAKYITFPSVIYMAARSFEEFLSSRARLLDINPGLEAAYWPTLKGSYWVSPFSETQDLLRLRSELKKYVHKKNLKVLIDLELPLLDKRHLLKNLPHFFRNRSIIISILRMQELYNFHVKTAVYPAPSEFHAFVMRMLGVAYPKERYRHDSIIMYYTSMIKNKKTKAGIMRMISKGRSRAVEKQSIADTQLGLGTIATGILTDEPKLSPQELRKDLVFAKRSGIGTAVVFRLGGLDKDYLDVIKDFI
jgi:hypothetical protein